MNQKHVEPSPATIHFTVYGSAGQHDHSFALVAPGGQPLSRFVQGALATELEYWGDELGLRRSGVTGRVVWWDYAGPAGPRSPHVIVDQVVQWTAAAARRGGLQLPVNHTAAAPHSEVIVIDVTQAGNTMAFSLPPLQLTLTEVQLGRACGRFSGDGHLLVSNRTVSFTFPASMPRPRRLVVRTAILAACTATSLRVGRNRPAPLVLVFDAPPFSTAS